eukprot:scaffold4519_cov71-Isochrysis_galbana.AAC.2
MSRHSLLGVHLRGRHVGSRDWGETRLLAGYSFPRSSFPLRRGGRPHLGIADGRKGGGERGPAQPAVACVPACRFMRQLVRYNWHRACGHVGCKGEQSRLGGAAHGGHDEQVGTQAGRAGAQSHRLLHPTDRELGIDVTACGVGVEGVGLAMSVPKR